MSQKDSSSKIKAQGGGRRTGSTKYRMQAAQVAAQEAEKEAKAQEASQPAQGSEPGEDNVRGLWKSRVLASYKGKSPKESQTLLAHVPTGKGALEVGTHYKTVNIQEVMISTVDKMFDLFQNNAYEFNRKVAAGTELECTWIRPFVSKEVTNSWHQSENVVHIFSGRVSTRRWTMVVKGTIEEVLVFILPADRLIGFALSSKNFKPYFSMVPVNRELDVVWKSEERALSADMFPMICKELFEGLIRYARDEAKLDERFSLRQLGLMADEETESEEDKAQTNYQQLFFEDMRSRQDGAQFHGPDEFQEAPNQQPQAQNVAPQNLAQQQQSGQQPNQQSGGHPVAQQAQPYPPQQQQAQPYAPQQQQAQPYPPPQQQAQPYPPQQQAQPYPPQQQAQPYPPQQPTQPYPPQQQAQPYPPQQPTQPYPPQQQAQPYPPQQQSGQHAMPPQQQSGQHAMPQQQQSGQHAMPPQQQSGQHAMPPQQQSGQQAMPPQQQSGQHATPPQHQSGQHATPPQHQSGQQAMPPQQQNVQQAHPQDAAPVAMPQPEPKPVLPEPQAKPPGQQSVFAQLQQNRLQAASAPNTVPGKSQSFPEALSGLLVSLDRELEVVAKAGSDAFNQRDLARADAALKFSARLSDFRDIAREILDYYRIKPR